MLVYNIEFIWICTLQNQSMFWTRLSPRPKYRLVLQRTHPIEFSMLNNLIIIPHNYWYQHYYRHITTAAHIQVFPEFHQHWAGALKGLA